MSAFFSVRDLRAGYGEADVLQDVALEVGRGEIVSVIGANGAGKTTLMLAVMGLLPVAAGTIDLDGRSIAGLSTFDRVREGVALVPERRQLFGEMTVEENLLLGAYARRDPKGVMEDLKLQYQRFPRLQERRHQKTRSLSGGEQQIAAIARALMARAKLLLLDEPSLGLSPKWIAQVMEIIRDFRSEGRTVLLVEQNAREALELADRGYVLETGRIIRGDTSAVLLADRALADAYLGGIDHAQNEMEGRIRAEKTRLSARAGVSSLVPEKLAGT